MKNTLKKMVLIATGVLILGLLIIVSCQNRKIQKPESRLLNDKMNANQKEIITVTVPKYVDTIAPLPPDKAWLGNILYGGE